MIVPRAHLVPHVFDRAKLEGKPTRMGYGEGLVSAADENKNIVALCADLTESTQTHHFQKKYPDRFVEMGVAEQIRTTICYNEQNVKVVGAHAGVSVGPDGATHQAIEDIAIMRVIPHMVVLSPCDALEAKKATIAAARFLGPVYIRFHREKTPVFTTEETPFEIGKAEIFFEPSGEPDVAIIAMGPLVHNALLAAEALAKEGVGVRVINSPSVKPLDGMIVEKAARDAGCIVTVEEHQIAGGLGSAVAEFLSSIYPVPIEFIGMRDRFGESGEPDELVEYFGMGVLSIQEVVRKVMKRKK